MRIYPSQGVQLTVKFVYQGQDGVIVLGGTTLSTITSAQGAAWLNQAWDSFRPLIAGACSATGGTYRDVSSAGGQVFDLGAPTNPTGLGGVGGPILAASTLIKWSAASGGRSGKGRTFLPALPSSAVASNSRTYDPSHVTKVNTAVSAYLNPAGSGNVTRAVLSFTDGVARPITNGAAASVIGIQRGRMR